MKEFSVEPVFAFVRLCALIRPRLYAGELALNEVYFGIIEEGFGFSTIFF